MRWPPHALVLVLAVALSLSVAPLSIADSHRPSVNIDHPSEGSTVNGTLDVQGSASASEGNLSHVEVRIDDGSWEQANGTENWTYEWDTTNVDDGEHSITVQAEDEDGNNATDERNVTVQNDQQTQSQNPSVTIEEPGEGDTVSGSTIVGGSASASEGNLSHVEVRIDDGPWEQADGEEDWTYAWDTTTVGDGSHTITARAEDEEGDTALDTANVTVQNQEDSGDGDPPTVTISDPDPGEVVEGTVNLQGTASSDDVVITTVYVRIDDRPWEQADGTEGWSHDWDTTTVEDGEHTITVRAEDDEGRVGTSQRTVQVDNPDPAPRISIDHPANDARVFGDVEIEGTAEAPGSSIDRVQLRVEDGSWRVVEGTEEWVYTLDTSPLDPGSYEITAAVFDEEDRTAQASISIQVEETEEDENESTSLSLSLALPVEGELVEESLLIEGQVDGLQDAQEEVQIRFRVDEGSWRSFQTEPGDFQREVEVTSLSEGDHALEVQAVHGEDASQTEERSFEVRGSEPADAGPEAISPLGLGIIVVAGLTIVGLIAWARQ